MKKNVLLTLFIGFLSSSVFALGTSVPGGYPCKTNSAGNTVYQVQGQWMGGNGALNNYNTPTGQYAHYIRCKQTSSSKGSSSNERRKKKFIKKR